MNFVYIDESGNTGLNLKDSQQPVFVLAGMILPESKWFLLEEKFSDIAKSYLGDSLPDLFELHAIDLKVGRGVFENLSFEKQLSFRDEMLQLLVDNKIAIIYRRIIKSSFEAFCEKNYGPGIKVNPYIMALPFVCVEVDHYLRQKGNDELGMFIFDEQKENLDDAERSLRTLRLDSASILQTTNIIEKGFFIDSSKSFALQLVDLAVYYVRKYEENKLKLRVSDFDRQTFGKIEKLISTGVGSDTRDILEWVKNNCIK
ncbi:MAG TPA: DUF3800 domain-containing protein [Phycisphaerales bacterium]|nr:DUF3800 domain-containing protein [Phycisphaerales bacterium]